MRFMMVMIPRVYQPDAPLGEKAGDGFAPPAEAVAKISTRNWQKPGPSSHSTGFTRFRRVLALRLPAGNPK